MKLLISFILFYSSITFAYDVNIYHTSRPGYVLIELVDDCQMSHKLLIQEKNLYTNTKDDWVALLFESKEWNKCQNFVD
jgi:hypothetical protein